MKIILTGGSGAVGQNVLDQLCENKALDIIAFDVKNKRIQKFYKSYSNKFTVLYEVFQ